MEGMSICIAAASSGGGLPWAGGLRRPPQSPKARAGTGPTWPEVARVLACLFEKDVEFQLIRPNNYKGLKRMPSLKGPRFKFRQGGEEGKMTLVDSRKICRRITEKYVDEGNKDLLGTGTLERASIERWLQTEARRFDPPSSALVLHLAFAPLMELEQDKEEIEQNKQKLNEVLDTYEKRLQETKFLAGDKFTLADLSHLPNAQFLASNGECRSLIRSRKMVSGWWDQISLRPSWQRVVEMQQEIRVI
ncbi:glutathione S-transferase F10-like [Phoenix dactylifera]|uniref:glutathione transferase n=1 Tax=Phoenix dactylifera TaxID=42345 RepID=A0A8B9AAP7_PHODC|nr:glutathione S-transferase F10-like [Phoenix dactylifera]